jgi:hypothetical protein
MCHNQQNVSTLFFIFFYFFFLFFFCAYNIDIVLADWAGGLSWRTGLADCPGGLGWRTGLADCPGGLSWRTGLADWAGGLGWRTGLADCPGGLGWRTGLADCPGGLSWRTVLADWDGRCSNGENGLPRGSKCARWGGLAWLGGGLAGCVGVRTALYGARVGRDISDIIAYYATRMA